MCTASLNLKSAEPNMLLDNNTPQYSNSEPPELQFFASNQCFYEDPFSYINPPYSGFIQPLTVSPLLGYATALPSCHTQFSEWKSFEPLESMDMFELQEMEKRQIYMNMLQELLAGESDIPDSGMPIFPPCTLDAVKGGNDCSRSDDEVVTELNNLKTNDATLDTSQINVVPDLYGSQAQHQEIQGTTLEVFETETSLGFNVYGDYNLQQIAQDVHTSSAMEIHLGHQYGNSASFDVGHLSQPVDEYNQSINGTTCDATYESHLNQIPYQNAQLTPVLGPSPYTQPTYSGWNPTSAPTQPMLYTRDPNPIPQYLINPEQTRHSILEETSGHDGLEELEEIRDSGQKHVENLSPSMRFSLTLPTLPVPVKKPALFPGRLQLELGTSISGYKKFSENLVDTNLKARLEKITEGEPEDVVIPTLGTVISSSLVYFAIDPTRHPILFHALNFAPHTDGYKYVIVQYDPKFTRSVRATRVNEKKRGRPAKTIAYQAYGSGDSTNCHSCGRRFGSRRGMLAHVDVNRGKRESCEVVWLQRGRTRCYFCDQPVSPTSNFSIIGEHAKVCKPLWELKLLIHPYHLEDTGLRREEIQAFEWPGCHI